MVETADEPLIADQPEIPRELALQGFDGVRAYTDDAERSRSLLEGRSLSSASATSSGRSEASSAAAPTPTTSSTERGIGGAGTVHHVAWASTMDDHEAWRERAAQAGARPTPVIDRFWFRSIYFREPSGVLFEIATLGPGFATDEDLEHLGESLSLPPAFEHLRAQVEPILTPISNPRETWQKG